MIKVTTSIAVVHNASNSHHSPVERLYTLILALHVAMPVDHLQVVNIYIVSYQ